MILRDRCSIWLSTVDRFGDPTWVRVAQDVPCSMTPVSSTEKEYRGTAVTQTYLWITKDTTIPFADGGELHRMTWNGKTWNVKGNLADVNTRGGRLHHREAVVAYATTPAGITP